MCIRSYTDYLANGTVVKVTFPDGHEEERFLYGNNAIPLSEYIARHQKAMHKGRGPTLSELTKIEDNIVCADHTHVGFDKMLGELTNALQVMEEEELTEEQMFPIRHVEPSLTNPHVTDPEDRKRRW